MVGVLDMHTKGLIIMIQAVWTTGTLLGVHGGTLLGVHGGMPIAQCMHNGAYYRIALEYMDNLEWLLLPTNQLVPTPP